MKQKLLTVFIIFIMLFSYSLIAFADEESQTITITGADSNTYTFAPYNRGYDGNCFLYYNTSQNRLDLYVFDKPVSRSAFSTYDTFKTLDGSTDNKRRWFTCDYSDELTYFDTWRNGSIYQFSKVSVDLSTSSLLFLAAFENTEPLMITTEDTTPEDTNTSTNTNTTPGNTNVNTDNNIISNTNTNVNSGNTSTNTTDITEINNNLSKIYEGIQFIISFFCLASVVLLIYIVYKFFLMFFTF